MLLAILVAFFTWQSLHLPGFNWDYDEGAYLAAARAQFSGYSLYHQVYLAHPPLFIHSLTAAFRLGGPSESSGRAVAILYAVVGLVAVAFIGRELQGWGAGLLATVLLAVTPDFLFWSRRAMLDLPAISLATLSMALALRYCRVGQRRWLLLAGLAFGASLLVKLITIATLIPLVLTLGLSRVSDFGAQEPKTRNVPLILSDLMLFIAAVALPILLLLARVDLAAFYAQVIDFHLKARAANPLDLHRNAGLIGQYLLDNVGLTVLAAWGALCVLVRGLKPGWLIISWLCLTGLTLLTQTPLYPSHHLVILLPAMAVLVGSGLAAITARSLWSLDIRHLALAGPALSAIVIAAWWLPSALMRDLEQSAAPQRTTALQAATLVAELTRPEDLVVSDEQFIVFWAGRNVSPPLSDTSHARINAGDLDTERAIRDLERYPPAAVILWSGRLAGLPAFTDWVAAHYYLVRSFGAGRQVYIAPERVSLSEVQFK